jgi:hypothetical protein
VQPQSNANASPFAATRLTVPGGGSREFSQDNASRGFAQDSVLRHRSGPRAKGGPPGVAVKPQASKIAHRRVRRPLPPGDANAAPTSDAPVPQDDDR